MEAEELKMPKFANEREEADWWASHPEFALQVLQRAKAEGRLGFGTVMKRALQHKPNRGALQSEDSQDVSSVTQSGRSR